MVAVGTAKKILTDLIKLTTYHLTLITMSGCRKQLLGLM